MKPIKLSRRAFLRGTAAGLGVSLALPPLEAMLKSNGAYADGSDDKPWFAVFYWANGLPWHAGHGGVQAGQPDLFTPATTGAGYAPTTLLDPLARHSVCVATGLQPHTSIPATPAGQGDGHMRGFMVAMTGDRPRSEGFDHTPNHILTALRPSLDQLVAKHADYYAFEPPFRSIQVGVSKARFHEYGHWNAISYNGPDSLNPAIMDPSAVFDRLFAVPGGGDDGELESERRGMVLDAVLEDARGLRQRLGARDRERLDAHLEHIHSIQRRLAPGASCTEPNRPSNGGDLLTRTDAMSELIALAVSCGLTKVVSFMLTAPATTQVFSNLGVPDGMHKTCHDGHWDRVRDITTYQMQAFARFLDAFEAIEKPMGGTLLDDGCVYGTTEYGEGWKHSVAELPVIIAGGACGRLNRGVHERQAGGNISRAQLTVLQALGLPFSSFGFNGGETSSPLPGILAA